MGYLTSRDGTRLHHRVWADLGGRPPLGTVVLLHGYADHIERYGLIARTLNERGLAVHGIDLRGHGQSDGVRGHIRFFSEYLEDTTCALEAARAASPGPYFLVGHSQGGLIALRYALEFPDAFRAVAVLSPYLKLALKQPRWKLALGEIASSIMPTLGLPSGLRGADATHDPVLAADYDNDPRNNKLARARWFTEATRAQDEVAGRAPELKLPCLFLVAGGDKIADPAHAQQVFERVGSSDKECEIYPDQYHELFSELPEVRARVMTRLGDWIAGHAR